MDVGRIIMELLKPLLELEKKLGCNRIYYSGKHFAYNLSTDKMRNKRRIRFL